MADARNDSESLDAVRSGPDSVPSTLNPLLLLAAVGTAGSLLWLASHAESWLWVCAAALGFSFVNNTIFSLLHESVHGKFHAVPLVNEWCGRIAAGFFPTSLAMQRAFHLGHHRRNRTEVERFDYIQPGENKFLKYAQWYSILTGLYWVSVPAGCVAYLLAPWVFRLSVFRSKSSTLAQQTSADAMFGDLDRVSGWKARQEILLSIAIQLSVFHLLDLNLFGWFMCYAAFGLNWSSLQYADHAWSELDVRNGAWNLRVNKIVQFLFLNYHHHLAHHRHPEVPWVHLHRYVDFSAYRPRFLSVYLSMWLGPRPVPDSSWAVGQSNHRASRPTAGDWGLRLAIAAVFSAFFCVVYGTTNLLTSLHSFRVPMHFGFEFKLPFVPSLSIVYCSLYLLMGSALFVFRSWQALVPLALTLMFETLCAAVFFLLMPVENAFTHEVPGGISGAIFNLADVVNLEHNWFPSLHVTFAWTTALAIGSRFGTLARSLVLSWAASISAAAVLTHQHYLIDVAGGLALAAVAMTVVYPRVALACQRAIGPAAVVRDLLRRRAASENSLRTS